MITNFTPFSFEKAISPESVGISSAAIAEFESRMRRDNIGHQGYMLYRHGKLAAAAIAEPYRFTDKRHVYSISKSWTSTAVGIAIDEGLLSVDDHLIDFFPECLPDEVSDNLAAMTVKHLLSMNTGHGFDTMGRVGKLEPGWAERFLAVKVEYEPGTHFCYNSGATYMLSAIITRLTGLTLTEYLRGRLFNPLGIEGVWWEKSADGANDGGWGIHVSPEDMLKLGVLYLNKGVWNNRRILSESYIADALSAVSDNSSNGNPDWRVGYGYQWWQCRHDCVRGDGAYGQYIIVSPKTDSVAVIISENQDMQSILDAYWETIFDSMSDEPLPEPDVVRDLSAKPFATCPEVSGEQLARVEYEVSESFTGLSRIRLESVGERLLVRLYNGERAMELLFGAGEWIYTRTISCVISPTTLAGNLSFGIPAEIACAWGREEGRLVLRMQFVSTPHGLDFVLDEAAGKLMLYRTLDRKSSAIALDLGCLYK